MKSGKKEEKADDMLVESEAKYKQGVCMWHAGHQEL